MDYLKQLQLELSSVLADLRKIETTHAAADKWSPDQILEHLYLTYKGTNKGLARCMASETPAATRSTLKQRVGVFVLLRVGYFPKGRKSPERAVPRGLSPEDVRAAILNELKTMDGSLGDAERKLGSGIKIMDHPILGPLTAEQWRKFHWVHGRHHFRQIRERMGQR